MILAMTEEAYQRRYKPGAGPAPIMLFRGDGPSYQTRERTAVLHFDGVVGRGFSWLWGAMADPADLVSAIRQAEADPDVDDILLVMDSPGGECVGVHEAHMALRACSKKTRAHVVGMCASAAYWIASAADEMTASPSAAIGCIGAIVEGWDDTKAMEQLGYQVKTLRSSRAENKAPDVGDDRWDAEMQPLLDELGDLFLGDIGAARGWGDDLDAIEARVESGRLFPARAALAAGLIDAITTDETPAAGEEPLLDEPSAPSTAPPETRAGTTPSPRPKEPTAMAGDNTETGATAQVDELESKLSEAEAARDDALAKVEDLEAQIAELKKDAEKAEAKASEAVEAQTEQLAAQLRREVAARHAETGLQSGRLQPKEREGFINALAPFVDDDVRAAAGWDDLCTAASAAGATTWASIFGIRARGQAWPTEAKTHGATPEGDDKPQPKTQAQRIAELRAEKNMSHAEAVDYLRQHEPELLAT